MTDPSGTDADPVPLRITFSETAEAEVENAYLWLQRFGFETAEKWLSGLNHLLEEEAALLASVQVRRQRAPDSPNDRELFILIYRTGRRRSSPWHVVYEIVDQDDDGQLDTLRVVRVRHAARQE